MVAFWRKTNDWLKTFTLPGFEGFPVLMIMNDIVRNVRDIRLFERAAAISFNLLMAIPPTLIFLASLVPFLPLQNVEKTIINAIYLLAPNEEISGKITHIVSDFLHTKRRDLLSFGIIFTIIYSSNGLLGLMRAFDRVSAALKFRTGFSRRLKAIRLTVILMVLFLIMLALLILQSNVLNRLILPYAEWGMFIKGISRFSVGTIIFLMICIIYKYGPSLFTRPKLFTPGAFFATFMTLLVSRIFVFVANNFIQYDKVYGSLGSLLMFLGWISIVGVVLLFGYEINISILLRKNNVVKSKPI